MAKAKREIKESLKLVDIVIEMLDARIPSSSRNPDINGIIASKPRLIVLNKNDLADPEMTEKWLARFRSEGITATAVDLLSGKGLRKIPVLVNQLAAPKMAALATSGRRARPARCIILGIPNVGKSYLINKLADRRAAKTGYKPGVTRGRQWIRMAGDLELLDTPGILWPKFDDPEAAFRLAVTGAIKEDIFSIYQASRQLVLWLAVNNPSALKQRYKLSEFSEDPDLLLEIIGQSRGFIGPGGRTDTEKAAQNILKEFREGKLGRITLDQWTMDN